MKTMDDALAVCQRENDNFYITAFMIEAWLSDVTLKTVAQYAERKGKSDPNGTPPGYEMARAMCGRPVS
jgi:hypothetical protein